MVFKALTEALSSGLKGFKDPDVNSLARHVTVSTSVSAWSWGERVTISVTDAGPGKSAMSISSATKTMVGSATSHSKNRKNVEALIRATTDALTRLVDTAPAPTPAPPPPPPPDGANPVSSQSRLQELKTLGELRDSGVLTQVEFEAEKARIMGTTSEIA